MGNGGATPPSLRLQARPELRTSPGLLQMLGMLPLAHGDLTAAVDRALAENPMLERSSGSPCPGCGRHRYGPGCPRCSGSVRASAPEPATSPFEAMEAAAGCEIRSDCRPALPLVMAHLTERGLLDCEPAEIASQHGLRPEAVAEAVRAIKAVGPVGVAERSVTGMLVAQAHVLVRAGEAAGWLIDLVRDHLPSIADGDTAAVAAALRQPEAAVDAAFRLVRSRLRPSAVIDWAPRAAQPPAPDVFVYRNESGGFEVEVADSRWFGLTLTEVPPLLRGEASAAAWLAEHERAARALLQQLDTRAGVLRAVAACVVRRQAGFFDRGPAAQAPLTRTAVAHELGVHPSTVSRAVAGKTLRCPDGQLVGLASLFGGDVAIKAAISDITGRQRMSDSQLCAELAAQGFRIARRTVAKYRSELGIAAHGRQTDRRS